MRVRASSVSWSDFLAPNVHRAGQSPSTSLLMLSPAPFAMNAYPALQFLHAPLGLLVRSGPLASTSMPGKRCRLAQLEFETLGCLGDLETGFARTSLSANHDHAALSEHVRPGRPADLQENFRKGSELTAQAETHGPLGRHGQPVDVQRPVAADAVVLHVAAAAAVEAAAEGDSEDYFDAVAFFADAAAAVAAADASAQIAVVAAVEKPAPQRQQTLLLAVLAFAAAAGSACAVCSGVAPAAAASATLAFVKSVVAVRRKV
jgi:hypothetical protein